MPSNGDNSLNVPLLISEHAPARIVAAREERDKLVTRIRELNSEIALLETHLQVGYEVNITDAGGKSDATQR